MNLPLIALAVGAFAIGVTEFAPMGMLPVIATGIGVSIPTAGLLISAYAIGVTIGAPLVTLSTTRVPRRTLLILLAGIFVAGNALSALSSFYEMLLVARVITSLAQGTFFGVGAIVAGNLVPAGKQATAVAMMFMGLTIANVVGVPAITWIAEQVDWRTAFWCITGLGIVTMLALRLTLPVVPSADVANAMQELKVLTRSDVLGALGLTALVSSSQFTVFTYISTILRAESGGSVGFITAMLTTYGVGMCVGNWLGGKFSDLSVERTLMVALAALAVNLTAMAILLPYKIPTALLMFLWGVTSFALIPALQIRVMGAAKDAPSLASSVNIGAFNLGNASGAALGGAVIATGFGYSAVVMTGALIAALALIIVLLLAQHARSLSEAN
ncbi:MFS transporter [Pseudomonas sp. NFX224]|uniref:MFS transporter n=1 Tax=Pseudomonas sp. NFX224 TaxID=3402862 RepID=UPI003AFA5A9D